SSGRRPTTVLASPFRACADALPERSRRPVASLRGPADCRPSPVAVAGSTRVPSAHGRAASLVPERVGSPAWPPPRRESSPHGREPVSRRPPHPPQPPPSSTSSSSLLGSSVPSAHYGHRR